MPVVSVKIQELENSLLVRGVGDLGVLFSFFAQKLPKSQNCLEKVLSPEDLLNRVFRGLIFGRSSDDVIIGEVVCHLEVFSAELRHFFEE